MEQLPLCGPLCKENPSVIGEFPSQRASNMELWCKAENTGGGMVYPDSKVHGANMGPTWVLSAPDGQHVGIMNLAIRGSYTAGGNIALLLRQICDYASQITDNLRGCSFNSLFRLTLTKLSDICITDHLWGDSTGNQWTHKWPIIRKVFPCYVVTMLFCAQKSIPVFSHPIVADLYRWFNARLQ